MIRLYNRLARSIMELADPYQLGEGPPPATVLAYIRANIWPLRRILALSLFFAVIAGTLEVWMISYAGTLIDKIASAEPETLWALHGTELIIVAAVILLLRPIAFFARESMNDIGIECNMATLVRWRAHAHLGQQSVGWFQQDLAGRTAGRFVDIGNHTADIVYSVVHTLAYGTIYMIGIVVLMAQTDIRLALPLLAWFALYGAMMSYIIPRMVAAQEEFMEARSALLGGAVDSFSNFDTLKLFSTRARIAEDVRGGLEKTRQRLFITRKLEVGSNTLLTFLEGVIMVGFVGYGVYLWTTGAATIGLIGSALALSFRITAMAEWIMDAVWAIFTGIGRLQDALKTVGQPLTMEEVPGAPMLQIAGGEIAVEGLSHHYGLAKGGLSGLDLRVEAGEKVGLVGPSGAGKSTLVNLILRFHEAEAGRITIDGQDIRAVDQDSLRAGIGMVSQQAALLHRSVRENIALARPDATQEEIEAAARQAQAHEFITALEDSSGRKGYDAHVGERGLKLSGGQRQRIAIARVILKDAPILILDEATSALDSEVEAAIQETLYGVMEGKTVIAIAHRLSTIAEMDRIVVLDGGRVVEMGTHADLLTRKGLYAALWARQSGGFIGQAAE